MRARDGEFAGDLGVMVAGAARAGKKGLACGPSVAAREGARDARGCRPSGGERAVGKKKKRADWVALGFLGRVLGF